MMQISDLSWSLPFDKTKKLNLERIVLSFKKHEDNPVSSITVLFSNKSNGLRVVLSSFSFPCERVWSARKSLAMVPYFTGRGYYRERLRVLSSNALSGPVKFPDNGPDKLTGQEVTGTFEKRAPGYIITFYN